MSCESSQLSVYVRLHHVVDSYVDWNNHILTASYFPALDLSNGEYELGLTNFETYNAIPNVTSTNNKFYFDTNDKIITIPEGSYELSAVNKYLRVAIRHIR